MLGPNVAMLRSSLGGLLTQQGVVQEEGGYVYDPDTDTEVLEYVTVYSGRMLIRPRSGEPTSSTSVTGPWFLDKYDVTLPANATAKRGDVVSLTVCPNDPGMVGVKFMLLDVPWDQFQIARNCIADLVDTPP